MGIIHASAAEWSREQVVLPTVVVAGATGSGWRSEEDLETQQSMLPHPQHRQPARCAAGAVTGVVAEACAPIITTPSSMASILCTGRR